MRKIYCIVLSVLFVMAAGCKKNNDGNTTTTPDQNTKGVVEVRARKSYGTFYEAYVVGQNNSHYYDALCTAEKFVSSSMAGTDSLTFYYWSDKTASELGYSNGNIDGTGSPTEFPYFVNYPCYITPGGNEVYGANGYFAGNSCGGGNNNTPAHDRYTKGVIEVRVTGTFNNVTHVYFEAYPVGQNYTFVASCSMGEKTITGSFGSTNVFRYFYWPNKTVLDLGYSSYSPNGDAKGSVAGIVTSNDDTCFTMGGYANPTPGTYGYFNGHAGDCH